MIGLWAKHRCYCSRFRFSTFLTWQGGPRGGRVRVDATTADEGIVRVAGRARLVLDGVFLG